MSSWAQAQDLKQLDAFFDLLYQNNKIMGSIAVLSHGEMQYNKYVGFQYISEKENRAINKQSKFRIGSVTKTFTAVMIFQLVDEGKITLNEKLATYFPEVPNANTITIANLLNHSSGLFDITQDETFNERQPTTKAKMLARIASHDVSFKPNEKHDYSNTNYVLLGYILEAIDKTPYESILQKRIVSKLKLKNTYYGGKINPLKNECLSYYYEDDASLHEAPQAHMSNPGGAGGIVSNPIDLVTFYDALFNNKLMSQESFKIMTTIKDEYGSGIFSAKKGGHVIFAHNGTIDFFKSLVVYIPAFKTTIALNANALDYSMMSIVFNTMTALSGKTFDMPNFDSITLSEAKLNQYTGTYACDELPYNLVFKTDGKVLRGAPEGSHLKDLKATQNNEFTLEALGVVLNFDLKTNSLLFKQAGETPKKCIKKQ